MTRADNIHCARVYLAQSRHYSRLHRGWSFTLLAWAGNARRRAMAAKAQPHQAELFGARA